MPSENIVRRPTIIGPATPNSAPIYVDSDDNILKFIPAGSGTTQVQLIDASSVQTLTNKTVTSPSFTGTLLLADGTLGVPALAFTSDPDNGLYRNGENTLGTSGHLHVSGNITVTNAVFGLDGKHRFYSTVTTLTGATDAIDISLGNIFMLSRAGAADAATLAAPAVGDNGRTIHIFSGTAFAHTITISAGLGGAGGTDDLITFTNRISASITLYAHAANWHVIGSNLATIS